MSLPIRDMRAFARGIGAWLWGLNSEMDAQQLEKKVKDFIKDARLDVDVDEFCRDAAQGYAQREQEYRDLQTLTKTEGE